MPLLNLISFLIIHAFNQCVCVCVFFFFQFVKGKKHGKISQHPFGQLSFHQLIFVYCVKIHSYLEKKKEGNTLKNCISLFRMKISEPNMPLDSKSIYKFDIFFSSIFTNNFNFQIQPRNVLYIENKFNSSFFLFLWLLIMLISKLKLRIMLY